MFLLHMEQPIKRNSYGSVELQALWQKIVTKNCNIFLWYQPRFLIWKVTLVLLLACLCWHCVKFCYHWSFAIILLCFLGVAWISCKKYKTHCDAVVFWWCLLQIQNFGPTFQTNTFNFVNVTEREIVSMFWFL